MMMTYIYDEISFLIAATLLGGFISFVYDNLRVLRRCIVHNCFFISMEDFLFWIWVTARIFIMQIEENNGTFRLFSVGAALVGMLFYHSLLGNFYIKKMTRLLSYILRCIYKLSYYILYPFFFLEEQLKTVLKKYRFKMVHYGHIKKIWLTTYVKMLKITLCKHSKNTEGRHNFGKKKNSCKKEKAKLF